MRMKTGSIGLSSACQTMKWFRTRLCRRTRVLSRRHNSRLNTSVINRAGGASHPTFVVQATRSWMDFIAARPFIGSMRGLVAMGLVRCGCIQFSVYCEYVATKWWIQRQIFIRVFKYAHSLYRRHDFTCRHCGNKDLLLYVHKNIPTCLMLVYVIILRHFLSDFNFFEVHSSFRCIDRLPSVTYTHLYF